MRVLHCVLPLTLLSLSMVAGQSAASPDPDASITDSDDALANDESEADLGGPVTSAVCPYSSVQIRVQRDTSVPWNTSATLTAGQSVHVGVFKNGWGVPVDAGGIQVVLVDGSLPTLILTSGWDTTLRAQRAGQYAVQVLCGGQIKDSASLFWQ